MSLIRVVLILVAYYGSVASAGCAVDPDSNGHVTIPSSWTQIATKAFMNCKALVSVTIHNSITSIGQQAFYGCDKLVSVVIPDSVTILGASAFSLCEALESATISNSLLELPSSTFQNCHKLTSVIFSSSSTLATIGQNAFSYCAALVSITLPDSVVSVGQSAFLSCSVLQEVNFGPNVQTLKASVFDKCKNLASLVIPDLVEEAPNSMCFGCTALKTLTISASMRVVSPGAFYQTSSLSTVIIRSQNITFGSAAFFSSGMLSGSNGNQVLLMKGAWRITGLPSAMKEFNCLNGACVCKAGYGNGITDESLASYYSCVPCAAGYTNDPPSANNCTMCPPGSYAEQAGQSTCTRCAAGRFSSASGSSTAEVCSGCPVGKYVATTGASACYSCPPGNICPVKGLAIYRECLGGTYQDMPGETKCKDCPAGRWQDREGSATCTLCDPGYYNAEQGAAEHSMCYPCEEGKYSLQAGSANCQECGKDTYTDQLGLTKCRPCKVGYTTEGVTTSGLGATRCEMKEQPCPAGYYQIIAADDSITCDICANGTYSTDGSKCTDCKAGSYSSEEGSSFCELCPPGKAGTAVRSNRSSDCVECPAGTYMYGEGATTCFDCPPGSCCPSKGMNTPTVCPAGRYTDEKSRLSCAVCAAGTYQEDEGSARCQACPAGKASAQTAESNSSACLLCPAGKYTSLAGTGSCTDCARGQFQPSAGATDCQVCVVVHDNTYTSNADRTDCEVDESLLSSSLMEIMFEQGLALSGTFIFVAVFVSMGGIVTYMREQDPDRLANYSRGEAVFYSFMAGFSFGADAVLILAVWARAPALALCMALARSLHFFGGIFLVSALFAPVDRMKSIGRCTDYILKDAYNVRYLMEESSAGENIWIVEFTALLAMCDLTMLQFMPWKVSRFYTMSLGYPSLGFMRVSMAIKTLQTVISVICEISYLALYSGQEENTAEESSQADALFAMNIIFGIAMVIMGLVVMCIRGEVLEHLNIETKAVRRKSQLAVGGLSPSQLLELAKIEGKNDGGGGDDGEIRLTDVYGGGEGEEAAAEAGRPASIASLFGSPSSSSEGAPDGTGTRTAGIIAFTSNPLLAAAAAAPPAPPEAVPETTPVVATTRAPVPASSGVGVASSSSSSMRPKWKPIVRQQAAPAADSGL